ncbi:hypothetical protein KR009_001211, partial [Drosophila setifemur]
WTSAGVKFNRNHRTEQLRGQSIINCLTCQTGASISVAPKSISSATGSGGESVNIGGANARVRAILCSVNSANNTRKLKLILAKQQQPQERGERLAVGTNLQNKLPASSADCHLSPSAETNIHSARPSCPSPCPCSCPYSLRRHQHQHHHHHRCRCRCCVRGCYIRCCCRCRDASHSTGGVAFASASASPASMLLPYQINQRATLLQHRAATLATATSAAATTAAATKWPHVPGAITRRAVPRIFKRDIAQAATTASPLTPQKQHPTVTTAAATSTISSTTATTTTRRSRLELILYTEVYEEGEDSVSPDNSESKSHSNSKSNTFWHKYGE